MKRFNRLLCAVLTGALLAGGMPVSAFAAEDVIEIQETANAEFSAEAAENEDAEITAEAADAELSSNVAEVIETEDVLENEATVSSENVEALYENKENHFVLYANDIRLDLAEVLDSYSFLNGYSYDSKGNIIGNATVTWSSDNTALATVDAAGLVTRVNPTSAGQVKITVTVTAAKGGYIDPDASLTSYTITNLIELYAGEMINPADARARILTATDNLDGYRYGGNTVDFTWDLAKEENAVEVYANQNNAFYLVDASVSGDFAKYFTVEPYDNAGKWKYASRMEIVPIEDEKTGRLLFDKDNKKRFENVEVNFTIQNDNGDYCRFPAKINVVEFKGKAPKVTFKGGWKLNSYFVASDYQLPTSKSGYFDNIYNHISIKAGKEKHDGKKDYIGYYIDEIIVDPTGTSSGNYIIKDGELLYNGTSDTHKGVANLWVRVFDFYGRYPMNVKVSAKPVAPKFKLSDIKERIVGFNKINQTIYTNTYGIAASVESVSYNSSAYELRSDYAYGTTINKKPAITDYMVTDTEGGFKAGFDNTLTVSLNCVRPGKENRFTFNQKVADNDGKVNCFLETGVSYSPDSRTDFKYSKSKTVSVKPNAYISLRFNAKGNTRFKKIIAVSLNAIDRNTFRYISDFTPIHYDGRFYEITYARFNVFTTARPGKHDFVVTYMDENKKIEKATVTVNVLERDKFQVADAKEVINLTGYIGNNASMQYKSQKSYFKPVFTNAAYGDKTITKGWGSAINCKTLPQIYSGGITHVDGGAVYCNNPNYVVYMNRITGCVSVVPRRDKILDGTIKAGMNDTVTLSYSDRLGNKATQKVTISFVSKKSTYKSEEEVNLFTKAPHTEDTFCLHLAGGTKGNGVRLGYVYEESLTTYTTLNKCSDTENCRYCQCMLRDFNREYKVIHTGLAAIITGYGIEAGSDMASKFDLRMNDDGEFQIALKPGSSLKPGKYKVPVEITLNLSSEKIKTDISVNVH